jgi:hypothetical protein
LSPGTLTKVVSACCGLAAFAIAVVAGLSAENPGEVILFRALICMVACQLVGLALGMVIERVITDSIELHKQSQPDPSGSDLPHRAARTGAATS